MPSSTPRSSLEERLAREGAALLVESVARIERGEAAFSPQDESLATHAGKIETPDAVLDWSRPAAVLERLVRAMIPDPIAWLPVAGGKLQVLRARALASLHGRAPGEVAGIEGEDLLVAAGEGALALSLVRPSGKKEMSGAAFARGKRLAPGSLLA